VDRLAGRRAVGQRGARLGPDVGGQLVEAARQAAGAVGGRVQPEHEVLEHHPREVGIDAQQIVDRRDRLLELDRRAAVPVLVLVLHPHAVGDERDHDHQDRDADLGVVEAQPDQLEDQLEDRAAVTAAAARAAAAVPPPPE
jgi:hypothetical protein